VKGTTVRDTSGHLSLTSGQDTSPPLGAVLSRVPVPGSAAGQPAKSERVPARLLSLREAAGYVGCSYWSVRDWCLAGILPTVALPPLRPRPGERPKRCLRRVLIDRTDLDALVDRHKTARRPL